MVFVNPQPTPEALAAGYDAKGGLARLIGGRPDKADFYRTWFRHRFAVDRGGLVGFCLPWAPALQLRRILQLFDR